jgi:hypothetical protein
MTSEMMQEVHRNAQAASIIKGSLCPEEYRKVQGREDARDIWNILKMSHEGDPKAKRHRIEALESELARYDWSKGESLQSLFDRLMVLVNKIRVLGSDGWSDSKVTRLFMRAYKEKDKSLARMNRDRDDYEEMTPHQLFAKIQQHESEEAPIKTRDSHALLSNEQDSSKKSKDQVMKIAQVVRTRLCSSRLSRSLYGRMTNIKEKERRGHAMNVARPVTSLRSVQTRRNNMPRKSTKGTS